MAPYHRPRIAEWKIDDTVDGIMVTFYSDTGEYVEAILPRDAAIRFVNDAQLHIQQRFTLNTYARQIDRTPPE